MARRQQFTVGELTVLNNLKVGESSSIPITSALNGEHFLDLNLKSTGSGSTDVYGLHVSLDAAGTNQGYAIHSLGKITAGIKSEVAGLYAQAQLSGGQATGQAYAAFMELLVDTGISNMPSGGVLQLASIVNGNLNEVSGFIGLRDYGTAKMHNLFNFIDLSATPGADTTIFSSKGLKIRIGSTTFYLPVNSAAGALSIPGTLTVTDTTEATSTAGAIHTDGGVSATKKVAVGTDLLMVGGDFDLSTAGTGTYDMILKDSVADALSIRRSTTDMMVFDSSTPKITITPATDITGLLSANGGVTLVDNVSLKFGSSDDCSLAWNTTQTNDALVLGLGASKSLVLMEQADIATDIQADALAHPGLIFAGSTATAGKYAYIRTAAMSGNADAIAIKVKGSGTPAGNARVIIQADEDSNDSDYIQFWTHDATHSSLILKGTYYISLQDYSTGNSSGVFCFIKDALPAWMGAVDLPANLRVADPGTGVMLVADNSPDDAVTMKYDAANNQIKFTTYAGKTGTVALS